MAWSPEQYLKFSAERNQPCLDLLTRLNGNFKRILDLGCGPGNSTQNLAQKFKNAAITGFDADDAMLQRAQAEHPNLNFVKGYAPKGLCLLANKFDLVFSNACIHWVKEQEQLLQTVYELLNPNGVFAVQIPLANESHFYKILFRLINEKWPQLKTARIFYHLSPTEYYNLLTQKFARVTLWKSDYYHVVGKEKVLEWYKGSGLRPYLALLNPNEQEAFLLDLQNEINKEYQLLQDGKVFLIMPRLFFIAEK